MYIYERELNTKIKRGTEIYMGDRNLYGWIEVYMGDRNLYGWIEVYMGDKNL